VERRRLLLLLGPKPAPRPSDARNMNPKNLLIALSIAAGAPCAFAQSTQPPPTSPPSEPVVVPQVDRRDVRLPRYPSNDFELGLYTGAYATESFGTSWVYGARVGYHLTEDFFVQGVYAQTKVTDEAFRNILPGGIFESKTQKLNYYNLSVGYNILPGEVFLFSSRARPSQFFIIGGVGSTKFVDQRKPTFNFGFGFRVFLTDYASLQVDLRDHIFSLDLLGKNSTTQNLELSAGLSFYF
jgi:outer membrane beta-barrel protein